MPTFTDDPGRGLYLDYVPNLPAQPGNWTIAMLDGDDRVTAVVDPGKNPVTNDLIDLGTGDDTAYAADGADTVRGGDGDDRIFTDEWGIGGTADYGIGTGADQASGDAGNDEVYGGGGGDTLHGDDGNDYLYGQEGADRLFGDDGIDSLYADDWYDTAHAGDRAFDQLHGGAGNDALHRGRNGDQLFGEDGNDNIDAFYVAGQPGTILISGGSQDSGGEDVLTLAYTGDVDVTFVFGANSTYQGTGVNISGIERISALNTADGDDRITLSTVMREIVNTGAGNDTINGGNGGGNIFSYDDIVDTGDGHDLVNAGGGSDWVTNRGGTDTINAGDGDDFIVGYAGATQFFGQLSMVNLGSGGDVFFADYNVWEHLPITYSVLGGAGNDQFIPKARGTYVFKPGTGNDKILASGTVPPFGNSFGIPSFGSDPAGDDHRKITLDYSDLAAAVTVDLAAGTGASTGKSDTIANDPSAGGLYSLVDDIVGTQFGDTLGGDGSANRISGGAGKDALSGEDGDDSLAGGQGDDILSGGAGNDSLGGGEDAGGADNDTVTYADAAAGVTVNLATNRATGASTDTLSGIEDVIGSDHNDKLTGDAGSNALFGLAGIDNLDGGGGDDDLSGGAGNDKLKGGLGEDVLSGGLGNDSLDGGGGDDDIASYAKASSAVAVSLLARKSSGGDGNDTLAGIEALTGSNFNDTLTGGTGDDTLAGGKGNDAIDGGAGTNKLDGGEGRDLLRFDSRPINTPILADLLAGTAQAGGSFSSLENIEDVLGGAKNDHLTGSEEDNKFLGLAGDDELIGGEGDDELNGGAGLKDQVSFNGAAAAVKANLATGRATGEGADTLTGVEYLIGSAHNDSLTGDAQVNQLWGQSGADSIDGGANSDDLSGGAGNDTVKGGAGDDHVEGGNQNDRLSGDAGKDLIEGGKHNDTMSGGDQDDNLNGQEGLDSLSGDAGNDELTGGAGNDRLNGGAGNDALFGDSLIRINGQVVPAAAGNDRFDGGAGQDSVSYAASKQAIDGSLDLGRATGEGNDTLDNIEALGGSKFNDTLEGSSDNNVLFGLAGNDQLFGLAGNDTIVGSAGRDTVDGGTGTDFVVFDSALRLQVRGLPGNVMEVLFGSGEAQGDVYSNIERFEGSPDGDTLSGTGPNAVRLGGGEGNDRMTGGDGGDRLSGGDGADVISGGLGNDTLDGGLGRDTLTGGDGNDAFLFSTPPNSLANRDKINGFDPLEDIIQLAKAAHGAAGPKGALGPGAFVVGPEATNPQQHVVYNPISGLLLYDADGDGSGPAVVICDVGKNLALSAADIFIV